MSHLHSAKAHPCHRDGNLEMQIIQRHCRRSWRTCHSSHSNYASSAGPFVDPVVCFNMAYLRRLAQTLNTQTTDLCRLVHTEAAVPIVQPRPACTKKRTLEGGDRGDHRTQSNLKNWFDGNLEGFSYENHGKSREHTVSPIKYIL